MAKTTRLFIWFALCIGLAFSIQDVEIAEICMTEKNCTNPKKEVKNGEQILKPCVTSDEEAGVICLLGVKAGIKCNENIEITEICMTKKNCTNPKKDVKNGEQILKSCVTSDGKDGVICLLGVKAGIKSNEKCIEYAKSVYREVYNSIKDTFEKRNDCAEYEPLIFHGETANPREFPHMAMIGRLMDDEIVWYCGGSLVSELFVLSAAHCNKARSGLWKSSMVRLGEYNRATDADENNLQSEVKDYDIVEWFEHPGYGSIGVNDIVLFKLNETVLFTKFVRPLCLNSQPHLNYTTSVATGWGLTENMTTSDILLKVSLNITDCTPLRDDDFSKETLICAADLENGRDTCNGDSGGPLQVVLDEPYCMFLLIGITSFGPVHCGRGKPGGYISVSHYLPWIESIVWP